MVRVATAVALWIVVYCAGAAQIIATVDRNVVGVNEAIRLTFEADGKAGVPDFSPLEEHFEILDRSQSQNLSIINGKTSRKLVWDLMLMATSPGEFQIPPIRFGADQSQPISITVKQQGTVKDEERTIYLNVEVDTKQPYIQQQIVFTVKLFRAVEVASATLSELEVEGVDAIVERFGEDKDYQIVQNGRRWLVVERKYIVFPQQSGYMTIRPLRFKGSIVPRQSNLGFNIFNQSLSKPVVLESESVTLQVREPPASFVGPWLPARKITMEESWPEVGVIKVGDPVTRTITVSALGLTAAQLPEFKDGIPSGLRGYPEQPKLENSGQPGGVLGVRTETTAMIPTQAGNITLPEIRLAWWNLDKQQPELTTIPARTFEVLPATPVPAEPKVSTVPEPLPEVEIGKAEQPLPSPPADKMTLWWPWISLGLGLVWLLTILFWVIDKRKTGQSTHGQREESSPVISRKQAVTELRKTISAGDARGTRDGLLSWGEALWPHNPPRSLGELARRCGEPVARPINDLEEVLCTDVGSWNQAALLKAVLGFKSATKQQKESTGGLEPLFRT